VNPGRPDLTVFYCSVRWLGRKYALLEFVAGETLEELVKRSDPAACEWQIPLFCRLLDAFDDPAKAAGSQAVQRTDLELIDFGIGRASASLTSKLHGAVLVGPGGDWSEQVFGEYGASRTQVYALLMALCARLPGELPYSSKYGLANLGECAVCSLATQSLPVKVVSPIAAPLVESGLLAKALSSPYVIAALTAILFCPYFTPSADSWPSVRCRPMPVNLRYQHTRRSFHNPSKSLRSNPLRSRFPSPSAHRRRSARPGSRSSPSCSPAVPGRSGRPASSIRPRRKRNTSPEQWSCRSPSPKMDPCKAARVERRSIAARRSRRRDFQMVYQPMRVNGKPVR